MEEDKQKTEHGQKTERGQQGQSEHGKKSLQPNTNSMAVKSKGVKTTGHVFDGIEESDRSLPKWWCLVFYISVVIAIIYASLYPSVPTNKTHFKGLLNTTDIQALEKTLELANIERAKYIEQIKQKSLKEILQNEELLEIAIQGGKSMFLDNCSTCHGRGGGGAEGGYPNLRDDDWIWGGEIEDIYQTIKYGVRIHEDARANYMPIFGADEILTKEEIKLVAGYVFSLTNRPSNLAKGSIDKSMQEKQLLEGQLLEEQLLEKGAEIFAKNCVSCHMEGGVGNKELGAPALNDYIWLYGGKLENIESQIYKPQHGQMPPWHKRFDDEFVKMLAIYVHQLGGGE